MLVKFLPSAQKLLLYRGHFYSDNHLGHVLITPNRQWTLLIVEKIPSSFEAQKIGTSGLEPSDLNDV